MKPNKILLVLVSIISFFIFSCTKTDNLPTTTATITVKNILGPVSGITVYLYDQDTWKIHNDNPLFAIGEATSDADGKAVFSNIEYPTVFNSTNNFQNNLRFSAYYEIFGINKKKVKSVTVNKGDQIELEIFLD